MPYLVEGETADEVWVKLAAMFNQNDPNEVEVQSGRGGTVYELRGVCIHIKNPLQRWVISRVPALNPAFALVEVIWIMGGRDDAWFLKFFNSQISKYAGEGPTFYGAYGQRLRHSLKFDQLERAYLALKANPDSRQVVLQIMDARTDMPHPDGTPRSPDIPCNLVSMLKIRNGKLHWTQIIRSNDLVLGLPHNIIQFTYLQEIMAGWMGVGVGTYTHWSDSLHVYSNQFPVEYNDPFTSAGGHFPLKLINRDKIGCGFEDSSMYWESLATKVDRLVDYRCKVPEFEHLSKLIFIPPSQKVGEGFQNILNIVCAEVLRRNKWEACLPECTNPLYQHLWKQWIKRLGESKVKKEN